MKAETIITDSNIKSLIDVVSGGGVYEGDINTLKQSGLYYVNGHTTHTIGTGLLVVFAYNAAATQMLSDCFSGQTHIRTLLYNNGGWDKWSEWKIT